MSSQELAGFGARMYAQGRLHQTRQGDRWVHIGVFVDRAVAQGAVDELGLQRLYDSMVKRGGEHVFGGGVSPDDPELSVVPGSTS